MAAREEGGSPARPTARARGDEEDPANSAEKGQPAGQEKAAADLPEGTVTQGRQAGDTPGPLTGTPKTSTGDVREALGMVTCLQ